MCKQFLTSLKVFQPVLYFSASGQGGGKRRDGGKGASMGKEGEGGEVVIISDHTLTHLEVFYSTLTFFPFFRS